MIKLWFYCPNGHREKKIKRYKNHSTFPRIEIESVIFIIKTKPKVRIYYRYIFSIQPSKSSLQIGDGVWPPGAWVIRHLICLVTLIINIYGLGVGISTIKKFTSGRGWGMNLGPELIMHLICLVTLIIYLYMV